MHACLGPEGEREAFALLNAANSYSPFVQSICTALANDGTLDRQKLNAIQAEAQVGRLSDYKEELLDLLLDYIRFALDDHILTSGEMQTVLHLKRLFAIKEGDFHGLRYPAVEDILHRQFERIYQGDGRISLEEAMHKVALQDVFDLSYDQFLAFKEKEVRRALARGAAIKGFDTSKFPKR